MVRRLFQTPEPQAWKFTIRPRERGRSQAASLVQRLLHTATLLPNGKLVVAGGWPDPVLDLYLGTVRSGHGNFDRDRPHQC